MAEEAGTHTRRPSNESVPIAGVFVLFRLIWGVPTSLRLNLHQSSSTRAKIGDGG